MNKGGIVLLVVYILLTTFIDYVAMRLLLAHAFMEICAWVILITSLIGGIMVGISMVCVYDDWQDWRNNKQSRELGKES